MSYQGPPKKTPLKEQTSNQSEHECFRDSTVNKKHLPEQSAYIPISMIFLVFVAIKFIEEPNSITNKQEQLVIDQEPVLEATR